MSVTADGFVRAVRAGADAWKKGIRTLEDRGAPLESLQEIMKKGARASLRQSDRAKAKGDPDHLEERKRR